MQTLAELQRNIDDLVSVAPKEITGGPSAKEAAAWVAIERQAESEVDEVLGPAIKKAFNVHKKLVADKKSVLQSLIAAKERVRHLVTQWICAGNFVEGCQVRTKYKVTITDAGLVPAQYLTMVPDEEQLQKCADDLKGEIDIPGVRIEPVHTLYSLEMPSDD